ncbi:MAG: hypothetical protein ABII01_02045 [Candidatus Woesearchaeota archaeon]
MRKNVFLTLSILFVFLLFNIHMIYGLNISIPPPPLPGQEGGNNTNASTPGDDLINDGGSGTTSTTQSSTPTSSTTSTTLSSSSTTSTTHLSSTTSSTTQSGTPTTTSTTEPHEENPSSVGLPLIYIIFQVITLLAVIVLGAISITTSAKLKHLSNKPDDHASMDHGHSNELHEDSSDIVTLRDYVKRNLEKGVESSVIKDALIKSGWPASKVDQAFEQRWS